MIIKNFLFHRVSDDKDSLWPPMKPELFAQIIRFITSQYEVVLLEDFLSGKQVPLGKRPVATILFDDGYKDNIEIAAPILRRFKCPASFYVVTDCITKNIPTWTYITDHFFQNTIATSIQLERNFVPDQFKNLKWSDKQEGRLIGRQIKPWMKTLSNPDRLWVMEQFAHNDQHLPRIMMNWDEVRQLKSDGFYIGSHSHTHPMLANLPDESEIMSELSVSSGIIQEELGHTPLTISYPIGSWDERVVKAATETGYQFGLAVEQRFYDNKADTIMTIPRVELYNEPWLKTRLRINGIYHKVRKLVR